MSGKTDSVLPTAADLMKTIALAEAEKAKEAMRARAAEEAEKNALLDRFSKPSGVDDEVRLERAAAIVNRAVANGLTEVQVIRFPNQLCTDRGRAINNQEPGWETTLTGLPKELYEFWHTHMRPRGYRLKVQVVDFPRGIPGDIGMTLCWG
ncbi:MAG: hypothetical protein HXX10_05320 [Rhodoplanes sp.]|uniref:hypothetical protein n=1 Tax=Rhodoplanes sp. TaxID=1968906 RepID=UPI0017F60974|nr:hypothetical protein [Rhodoplanes sp.]NVO13439.1 hypothetical protein [Rhodoplanes sp.]